jgi:hypothetical protein
VPSPSTHSDTYSSDDEPQDFIRLVDEVELAAGGEILRGSGRADCLRAYLEHPRAFGVVVHRAIDQADAPPNGSPIRLLVWKVRHGEVEKTSRAAARAAEVEGIPL